VSRLGILCRHNGKVPMPLKFKPKMDKIVELLLYLAHKRPGADKYQAVKFFYLADREHLNRYGRPITFEHYYALDYGPVASNALNLLEDDKHTLRKASVAALPFETETGKLKNGKETIYIRRALREVNTDLFSKSDLRVFDEIIAKYGDASFEQLYNETHKHFAYTEAWDKRRFGQKRAEMFYDDMIEGAHKEGLIEDLLPVSANMR
jgi:uncharacterized phage-associated protein